MPHEPAVLTDRQRREIEYHRSHAAGHEQAILGTPFSYDVLDPGIRRRWWNAHWSMYTLLGRRGLSGRRVLVLGCGFGKDAILAGRMGAEVHANDLSPESLSVARRLADREGIPVRFVLAPVESLPFPDDSFDCVIVRDILHHAEVTRAMAEVVRVSRPGAFFACSEIYSHSSAQRVRVSWPVNRILYPALKGFVYRGQRPYITEDERKLDEADVAAVLGTLAPVVARRYYNFVVNRLLPDRFALFNRLDRMALAALGPLSRYLGGRVLIAGEIRKGPTHGGSSRQVGQQRGIHG